MIPFLTTSTGSSSREGICPVEISGTVMFAMRLLTVPWMRPLLAPSSGRSRRATLLGRFRWIGYGYKLVEEENFGNSIDVGGRPVWL